MRAKASVVGASQVSLSGNRQCEGCLQSIFEKKCRFLSKINSKIVDTRVQKTTIQKHSYSSSDVAKVVRSLPRSDVTSKK